MPPKSKDFSMNFPTIHQIKPDIAQKQTIQTETTKPRKTQTAEKAKKLKKTDRIKQQSHFIKHYTYTRVTWLSWLQVMWNQVHGFTRFGSQLWSTLSGSVKPRRSADSASPSELPLAFGRNGDEATIARATNTSKSLPAITPPPIRTPLDYSPLVRLIAESPPSLLFRS